MSIERWASIAVAVELKLPLGFCNWIRIWCGRPSSCGESLRSWWICPRFLPSGRLDSVHLFTHWMAIVWTGFEMTTKTMKSRGFPHAGYRFSRSWPASAEGGFFSTFGQLLFCCGDLSEIQPKIHTERIWMVADAWIFRVLLVFCSLPKLNFPWNSYLVVRHRSSRFQSDVSRVIETHACAAVPMTLAHEFLSALCSRQQTF